MNLARVPVRHCQRICWMRRLEAQRAVRPVAIVVGDEASQDVLEMLFVQDQQPVETLRANGAHEALRHAVRLRRPERRTNNLVPNAAKYFVETGRELLVPVANQIPEPLWAVAQAPRQLAGLLGHPLRARPRRAAGQMHAPATQLDEEEDIQPLEPNRADREEVDDEHA